MSVITLTESEAGSAGLGESGHQVRVTALLSLNGQRPAELAAVVITSAEDADRKIPGMLREQAAGRPANVLGAGEIRGRVGALLAINGREPNEVASVDVEDRDDAAEAVPDMLRELADHLEEHGPFYRLIAREFS